MLQLIVFKKFNFIVVNNDIEQFEKTFKNKEKNTKK